MVEGLDDSWTYGNTTVTLRQLLNVMKDIPVTELPVSSLSHLALHGDNKAEYHNILKADLQYPILVILNDDNSIKFIIDGHHRLQKAMKMELSTIKCKLIQLTQLPNNFQKVLG